MAEDCSELQLLNRGRDTGLVCIMRSHQLLEQSSAIFHHVFCSETLILGLSHLNIRSPLPAFIIFLVDLLYKVCNIIV